MATGWPKRPLVLVVALVFAVCLGAVAKASRSGAGMGSYARVLRAAGAFPAAAADPLADCLMATTLLRRESGPATAIDAVRFEALRSYCRAGFAPAGTGETPRPSAPAF